MYIECISKSSSSDNMNQIMEHLYMNSIMNIQDIRYIKDHEI